MLSPRLTNCVECEEISSLIIDIDCKLSKMSMILYHSMTLMINTPFYSNIFEDLLHYKKILQHKQANPLYAKKYSLKNIASKVKKLVV